MALDPAADNAMRVLSGNLEVKFGIFGTICLSGYFPPRLFLNEFLMGGNDPCDQDCRMEPWSPFALSAEDYDTVKAWWISRHQRTIVDALGADCWEDWVQEMLERMFPDL